MAAKYFKWIAPLWSIHAVCAVAAAPGDQIPQAGDLAGAAREADRGCTPLMLEFAAERCPYCRRLEQEYLLPMHLNPADTKGVVMRRLLLNTYESVTGFDNRPTDADSLAARYSIKVTPTLLFLDARGSEIAERMVGFNTPELYGAYLDAAIDAAGRQRRDRGRCGGDSGNR